MNRTSTHRALCAGLSGASLALMPTPALGLSLSSFPGQLLSSPLAPFVAGVLGGAAVAGGVYGILVKMSEDKPAAKSKRTPKRAASAHVANHFVEAPVAASVYKPRHMSPQDFEKSGVIRVQPAKSYVAMEEQISAKKQKHLKSTIQERFDATMMDGIPVLKRADGTVADLGTSWWTRGMGDKTLSYDEVFADERPVDEYARTQKDFSAPQTITHRVAQIDEGLYPEKRTADDLDKSDMWTSALEALDEKLGAGTPQRNVSFNYPRFADTVGGTDTLDEPDDLAQNTDFILFRVPAGHPEVTDTESYINHLVSDEFSRSSSATARTSSRHFMRVIEGGTHNLKVNSRNATGRQPYVGKHFAPLAAAAQA